VRDDELSRIIEVNRVLDCCHGRRFAIREEFEAFAAEEPSS
jgi:hypothetical protein